MFINSKNKIIKNAIQILFFYFVSFSVFSQAQNDTLQKTKESEWAICVFGSSTFTIPTYYFKVFDDGNGHLIYGFGSNIKYKISKRFFFQSGVIYDFLEYESTFDFGTFLRKDILNYSLISVPMLINIKLENRKLSCFFNAGIQLSVLVNNNFRSYRPYLVQGSLYKNGSNCVFAVIGLGIGYNINDKINIFLETQLLKGVTPFYYTYETYYQSTVFIANHLKYFRSNFGILYSFNKF